MKSSSMQVLLSSLGLVAPLLAAGNALAATTTCTTSNGTVVTIVDPSTCHFETSGGCTSQCVPASFTTTCSTMCTASAATTCTDTCDTKCNTACTTTPTTFTCKDYCSTDCNAGCMSDCTGDGCAADCSASCDSQCTEACMAHPGSTDCTTECADSCTGSCTVDANISCDQSCTSTLTGGCTTRCSQPNGSLFCDNQYIDVAAITDCTFSIGVTTTGNLGTSCAAPLRGRARRPAPAGALRHRRSRPAHRAPPARLARVRSSAPRGAIEMKTHRMLLGTMAVASLAGLAGSAHAQSEPAPAPAAPAAPAAPEAPPPAAPSPSAAAPASPAAPAVVVVEGRPPADKVKDGVRLRAGISLNGGVFLLPANPAGGAVSIGVRLGVQFNHYLSLYYQNTPILGANAAHDMRSATVVVADYNSALLNLTLLHMLDIGAGPSLDYVGVAKGTLNIDGLASSANLSTGSGVAGGGHARVAFNIGGLSGNGPRRSGFAIGVDAHPMFMGIGKALSLTAGLGAEWY